MLFLFLRASAKRKIGIILLIVLFIGTSLIYNLQSAKAGGFTTASNKVTNSTPGATNVQYVTTFTFPGIEPIKCMIVDLTTSAASPSAHPTGLTTTSSTKQSVSGGGLTDGQWTLYNSVNGVLQYESAATHATTATAVIITTNGITNPTSAGVIYAQVRSFRGLDGSHNCTNEQDVVLVAFAITTGQALSVVVDPSLTFSINGVASGQSVNGATTTTATVTSANTIPLGNVNPSTNAIVAQDLVVTTNALNGYTIYASYSATLSDGLSHTIADWTGTNGTPTTFSSAGTSAFGYTTEDTNLSRFQTNKWAKFETWGYPVATATTKVSSDTNRVGYQVGVSGTQESGTYTTTVILTATPTY